jgi:hypothetical protein
MVTAARYTMTAESLDAEKTGVTASGVKPLRKIGEKVATVSHSAAGFND